MCVICDIFNTKANSPLALIKKQGLTGTALSVQTDPFGFERSDHLQVLPGDHKLRSLIEYLSSVTYKASGMEGWRGEQFTTFWSDFICNIVKGMRKI